MKFLPIFSAGLFATLTVLSFSAQAREPNLTPEGTAPAAETQTDKAPAKTAKRHSHVEEKTGMAVPEATSESKPDKAKADKDKSKHLHPRDAK